MSLWDILFGTNNVRAIPDHLLDEARARLDHIERAMIGPHGSSTKLYEDNARLVKAANLPDQQEFAASVGKAYFKRCDALRLTPAHDAIILEMLPVAEGLYAAERKLTEIIPNPTPYDGTVGGGQLRDMLLAQQAKLIDPQAMLAAMTHSLVECFIAITRHLPLLARDGGYVEGVPMIPLLDLLPNVGIIIEDALNALRTPEVQRLNLFKWFFDLIAANAEQTAERSRSKRPVPPSSHDGSPSEIVETYLKRTQFNIIFEARIPFNVSIEDRGEHTAIIAGSGWGKTQLLQTIIANDLEYDDTPGMVIIDSTGAMPQRIQRLAIFNDRLKDRLIIIDPESDPVPALNMFDMSNPRMSEYSTNMREAIEGEVIALFNYVFSSIQNPLTTRMQTAFTFMVRLLLSIPGANMRTLLELLDDDPAKGDYERATFKPYIDKLDETTQHFFKVQYYTGKESGLREQIRARVFDIIKVPAFERMFAGVNRVDFFAELNRGSIIVINTSENLLKEGSPTFGRYMIARVMAAAFERATIAPENRRQAFLIVDEAAPYFDETFEKLLTRVRQFKLGVCIAFQHLDQASEKLRSAIASSTAVKYGGGTGYADARWLGHEMRVDPEFIQAQKRDSKRPPQWSQFACYVRNYTDRAVSLTVPFYALESMPQMSDAEHTALLERNRARVSAPVATRSASTPLSFPQSLPPTATTVTADASETAPKTTAHVVGDRNTEMPDDEPGPAAASRDSSATAVSGPPVRQQKQPPTSQDTLSDKDSDPPSEGATNWS